MEIARWPWKILHRRKSRKGEVAWLQQGGGGHRALQEGLVVALQHGLVALQEGLVVAHHSGKLLLVDPGNGILVVL